MKTLLTALAFSLATVGASYATTLLNETVTIEQNFEGNTFFNVTTVVDNDIEFGPANGAFYTLDISEMFIDITLNNNVFFTQDRGLNGPSIEDTFGTIDAFSSVTLVSSTFLNTPLFTFTDDRIQFDFGSAGNLAGTTARFSYSLSPVPLPAGLPLLVGALGGLALARRKRRAA